LIHLTNAEADYLARHAEDAAALLREMRADQARRRDAMDIIGEKMMAWYHAAKADIIAALATQLETDAADLRARRKPDAPAYRTRVIARPRPTAAPTARQRSLATVEHDLREAEQEAAD